MSQDQSLASGKENLGKIVNNVKSSSIAVENLYSNLRICACDTTNEFKCTAIEACYNALKLKNKGELKRYNNVAEEISKNLNGNGENGAWHVIVGKSFGSFISHETNSLLYFFLGEVSFLLFKHG